MIHCYSISPILPANPPLRCPIYLLRYADVETHPEPTDDEIRNAMLFFEKQCQDFRHSACKCCRMVSLNMRVNSAGYCIGKCSAAKDKDMYLKKGALPLWYDGDTPMYRVPECLLDLTHAEKMLIQRISPFVPLHHIKLGIMGLTGHCCAFEQDVEGFVDCLPRTQSDVVMLKVLKTSIAEIGGLREEVTKAFRVRKKKVYEALVFLKDHHSGYTNIKIDMSSLDWIEGEEGVGYYV